MDFENIPSLKISETISIVDTRKKDTDKREENVSISKNIDSHLSDTFIKNYFMPSKK